MSTIGAEEIDRDRRDLLIHLAKEAHFQGHPIAEMDRDNLLVVIGYWYNEHYERGERLRQFAGDYAELQRAKEQTA